VGSASGQHPERFVNSRFGVYWLYLANQSSLVIQKVELGLWGSPKFKFLPIGLFWYRERET
jgi:hypothetical protein